MLESTVTSEIYDEFNYKTNIKPSIDGNVVSQFPFLIPSEHNQVTVDKDNDLDIPRPIKRIVKIEHSARTNLQLVGLQVWRGAFLLADYMIHLRVELQNKTLLEVGAGTGLTSFIASLYAKRIICTDIDKGGILELIRVNQNNNASLIQSEFQVMKLDFLDEYWDKQLLDEIENVDIFFAADVVYDDDITESFINTIVRVFKNVNKTKVFYIALEKRYVFTLEALDSVAPCYETFLSLLDKVKCKHNWFIEEIQLDFPKFFQYDRVKELVMWKIVNQVEKC